MKGRSLFSRSAPADLLPLLPLRGTVLFPLTVMPIAVSDERSVALVNDALRSSRVVATFARRDEGEEEAPVGPGDIFSVGTLATIHQLLRAPGGELRIILQGLERIRLVEFVRHDPYPVAKVADAPETGTSGFRVEALARTVRGLFQQLLALTTEIPGEINASLELLTDPRQVAYQITALVPFLLPIRQELLEVDSVETKLDRLVGLLQHEIAIRELQRKITSDTREQISKDQRDHILREQIRSIQRELGGEEGEQAEARELRERVEQAELPAEARKEAERELGRLERTPVVSPEHGLIRTYLEWLAALPWNRTTGGQLDVAHAREVLDADHHDLEKVKDRILEHLSVMKLRKERLERVQAEGKEQQAPALQEPILCLVGSPGVGKTSLGKSIARALGRKFVRISLGGLHDEAEIRGHRRTYIGAMPGRLIQALRRAEAADPVFMLDEVDKLGVGFHGDPASALLEVLDPAQNNTFVDTYLGVPFDLSRVLFLCTANTVDAIPPALLDRMELLRLPGYTEEEKLQIARRFLLPRLQAAHGLAPGEVSIDDAVLRRIVREYTREAGVRELERRLAGIYRKAARQLAEGAQPPIPAGLEQIPELLGRPPYFQEVTERIDRPGVATGLAWTPVGGDILFVEAALIPAREERLILTGMLGDVMRESAQAALSYLRSNARQLGLDPRAFESRLAHIHVPAGAIPKDGPSAGVAMATALASVASGRLVRNDVALTGEISLRGKVLPVGGIKEKVLAAHRAGVKTVLLPRRNEDALAELPEEVRRTLHFQPVESVDDVLQLALEPEAEVEWLPPPQAPEPMH